jgi:uncharacterized SAM-binding protein YcdF (DUF218 family)
MTVILTKLLWIVVQPSNLLLLALLAGALALWLGWRRTSTALTTLAALGLLLISVLPLGQWLLVPLENRFPALRDPPAQVDGIIVMGGGIPARLVAARDQFVVGDTAERFTTLLELAKRYPAARLVFTGGSPHLHADPMTEAEAAARFYRDQGLDLARLTFESQSRNTYENALLSKRLVEPAPGARWLLVTSAFHMPRAVGVFRQVGWPVVAYPVDYRTTGEQRIVTTLDVGTRLQELDLAAASWLGLVVYRLLGQIDELFPAP